MNIQPISDPGLFIALSIYLFSTGHWIGGSFAVLFFFLSAK